MFLYSIIEICWILLAAIVIDLLIGDPKGFPHPVIWIGKLIHFLESKLRDSSHHSLKIRYRGIVLTVLTLSVAFTITLFIGWIAAQIHPWVGYLFHAWFISTTIAIKGLKDAAYLVYRPLETGNLTEARKYVGYIVGRDTTNLDSSEITRAAVETVSENIVDAVISPLLYALLGGAPLAMLYRASNTLDSMVGYKNEKYQYFGWASARWDDVMNYIPARLTGLLIIGVTLFIPTYSTRRTMRSIWNFAHLHPSPNSGIPESGVAGALGIQLGGRNQYGQLVSERARMGFPLRPLHISDIKHAVCMLYGVSMLWMGGVACILWWIS